jgi:hypothetical protein
MGVFEIVATVIGLVVGAAASIFPQRYSALKKLINTIGDALEDDNLSKDEIKNIYKQAKKLL